MMSLTCEEERKSWQLCEGWTRGLKDGDGESSVEASVTIQGEVGRI